MLFIAVLYVCVVDEAFVSSSEVIRLGAFGMRSPSWNQLGPPSLDQVLELQVCVHSLQQVLPDNGVLQLPALVIQVLGRWTRSTSIHSRTADCTSKAKYTNLCQEQKCLIPCSWSLSVSGLQCPGQIRAETAILWYVCLRTCLCGGTTCGVGLVLTSSVWSVKKIRSSLCMYDYINMCFLRQD